MRTNPVKLVSKILLDASHSYMLSLANAVRGTNTTMSGTAADRLLLKFYSLVPRVATRLAVWVNDLLAVRARLSGPEVEFLVTLLYSDTSIHSLACDRAVALTRGEDGRSGNS